jgi:hypothetical protein
LNDIKRKKEGLRAIKSKLTLAQETSNLDVQADKQLSILGVLRASHPWGWVYNDFVFCKLQGLRSTL